MVRVEGKEKEETGRKEKKVAGLRAAYIGETGFTLSRRFSQHISHLRRYIHAEQELEDAGHSTTTNRGRPSSVPPAIAICRRGMAGVFEFLLGMNVSPKVADVL
ncbi:hypothetical protein M513_13303 [Trichuris suis]|uniref:Uncharacterized protein n=1 Tax=Trichuris suis TaxID=68888 RepID=A0A085LLH6_9BILA|nr:hypothetical protein M513_13303 [Trichuris suis]